MDKKLEQLLYIALGGALSVKEKLEKNSEEISKWQSEAEANARAFLDELSQRGAQEKDHVKELLREQIKEVINELGLATKADLEELKKDLKN
jgi:polyhydroxyalkanoate synthesis regulator phasin